ncbi:hypothetical protein [Noviherbaspirillum sp.]|jgi:hypothetical protein|uniref:hypothetical protein n=1 Tax=Noviherbaspirillum sp. TaxID=1926288 RepID=UPI0025E8A598|nr:hypothetical protein [Noviherbaspirillum sp.]
MANATIAAHPKNDSGSGTTYSRIDSIQLFGSQKLTRDGDSSVWIFSTDTTKPKKLTRRESMFINAALRAAGSK